MKIGIIGQGFVGNAVRAHMEKYIDVYTYDIDQSKCNCESFEDVVTQTDEIIFVCLPTPMKKTGECDTSIINGALNTLNSIASDGNKRITAILKSTIPPGTTDYFNSKYQFLNVRFNPEFLTEANSVNDYESQNKIIIGGGATQGILDLFSKTFNNIPLISVTAKEAEMCKYVVNTFLALKVSFANEISNFCDAKGISYQTVIDIAKIDERLGTSHWSVPGPDGHKGYSGSCFVKDINALMYEFDEASVPYPLLSASWKRNYHFDRINHDWENLKGRAVV